MQSRVFYLLRPWGERAKERLNIPQLNLPTAPCDDDKRLTR